MSEPRLSRHFGPLRLHRMADRARQLARTGMSVSNIAAQLRLSVPEVREALAAIPKNEVRPWHP